MKMGYRRRKGSATQRGRCMQRSGGELKESIRGSGWWRSGAHSWDWERLAETRSKC